MRKEGLSRYCWDENLFLFFLSLTAAISIHYYAVIMAFILCGSFAVFLLRRMFSKEHFIPLACSVLCACVIAGTPMAGAMISGTQFNASINWAVGAMNGEETRALEEKTSADRMKKRERPVFAAALETAAGVYMKGYAELYGRFRAGMILFVTAAGITLCFLSGKRLPDWMGEICSGIPGNHIGFPLLLSGASAAYGSYDAARRRWFLRFSPVFQGRDFKSSLLFLRCGDLYIDDINRAVSRIFVF